MLKKFLICVSNCRKALFLRPLICVLPILLAACAGPGYDYILPDSASGRACTAQCAADRAACRAEAERAHQQCTSDHAPARRLHETCALARGNISADCLPVQPCAPPDYSVCADTFRICWQGCGGEIREK
jgi:hypothetical protein